MNRLLDYQTIEAVTGGEWITSPREPKTILRGGAFDTRALGDAEIFFAWKGESSDGHLYLEQLRGSKTKLIIVEKRVSAVGEIPVLLVKDTLTSLHQLASKLAQGFKGKLVNLTGSSGKTTAKEWLKHIVAGTFNLLTNEGSFNNHIGCPITILNLKTDTDLLVLEMGTSGSGELELLSGIAPADIALLLNVGHAHLGLFGSIDNTYRAKLEIFSHLRDNAIALISADDPKLEEFLPDRLWHRFGQGSDDFSWGLLSVDPQKRSQRFEFKLPDGRVEFEVERLGDYVGNLLSAVFSVCYHLGMKWEHIHPSLAKLPQEKGRATFFKGAAGELLFDDTYNANPESVIGMLRTICSVEASHFVGVIGNLAELDEGMRESSHYIIENIPENLTDLILSGETGKILQPLIKQRYPELNAIYLPSVKEIIGKLQKIDKGNTVIGVKGSRSSHLERVIYALKGEQISCQLNRCGKLMMCVKCNQM